MTRPRGLDRVGVAAGLGGLILTVALRGWLALGLGFPGDRWQAPRLVHHPHHAVLTPIADVYGALASPAVAILVVVGGAVLLAVRLGPRVGLGLLVAAVVIPINVALKHAWGPTPLYLATVGGHAPSNYPSGHVSYAVGVFGYLALAFGRAGWWPLAGVAAVIALGMGPARIVSDAHLISDCVGGYLLGAGWLVLAVRCARTGHDGEWAILGSNQ